MNRPIWHLYLSEFIGTALLLAVGLSVVIYDWGSGSWVAQLIPSVPARRLITGFLFGTTGCLITLSPVGKISGAHINPAMSFAFYLRGKMKTYALAGYILSQMLGAVVGCLPLLLWGRQGASVQYGITLPGSAGIMPAFWGEVITTAIFVTVIFVFAGQRKLRRFTPFTVPLQFSLMVWAESAYSGTSTNPARSFGPAVISYDYHYFWIYVVAPLLGAAIVVGVFRLLRLHELLHLKAARVSYHDESTHESIKHGDAIQ